VSSTAGILLLALFNMHSQSTRVRQSKAFRKIQEILWEQKSDCPQTSLH